MTRTDWIVVVRLALTCGLAACAPGSGTGSGTGDAAADVTDPMPTVPCDAGGPVRADVSADAAPVENRMVLIPAGTFTMGSPVTERGRVTEAKQDELQHPVTLTRAFYMQAHEVTQGEWRAVTGVNPSYFAACGDDCPVENIDWYSALAYANALSLRDGYRACYRLGPVTCADELRDWARGDTECQNADFAEGTACPGYRLPTEAEWEYAYRAGTQSAFYTGDITETRCGLDPVLDAIGWYCGNAQVDYPGGVDVSEYQGVTCGGTLPVARKTPNAWGLYDMAGNVWEYCWDWHGAYPVVPGSNPPVGVAQTDPLGPPMGDNRIIRGGSWHNYALDERAARHNGGDHGPNYRGYARGFRLVRTAP